MEDPLIYRNILRMTPEKFEELFEHISPVIQKENTRMRMALLIRTKLEITLRFMAAIFLKILYPSTVPLHNFSLLNF